MNPESHAPNPPELEARITALLLGELTAPEAAEVQQALERDPALAQLHDRLKATLGLVREAVTSPAAGADPQPVRLSEGRRERLLAAFKVVHPRRGWTQRLQAWLPSYLEVAAAFVIMVCLLGLLLPSLAKAKTKGMHVSRLQAARDYTYFDAAEGVPAAAPSPTQPEPRMLMRYGLRPGTSAASAPSPAPAPADSAGALGQAPGRGQTQLGFEAKTPEPAAGSQSRSDNYAYFASQGGAGGGGGFGGAGGRAAGQDQSSFGGYGGALGVVAGDRLTDSGAMAGRELKDGDSLTVATPALQVPAASALEPTEAGGVYEAHPTGYVSPSPAPVRREASPPVVVAAADAAVPFAVPTEGYAAPAKGAFAARFANAGNAVIDAPVTPPAAAQPPVLGDVPSVGVLFKEKYGEPVEDLAGKSVVQLGIGLQPAPTAGKPMATVERLAETPSTEIAEKVASVEGRQSGTERGRPAAAAKAKVPARDAAPAAPAARGALALGQPQAITSDNLGRKLVAEVDKKVESAAGLAKSLRVTSTEPAEAVRQQVALLDDASEGAPAKGVVRGEALRAKVKADDSEAEEVRRYRRITPSPLVPQPEVAAADNAFSTFSLNVTDVAFKLAAASLENGQLPDPASIRSEEFVNAFDYGDPAPPPGASLAFAWERAQYPYAHHRELLRFTVQTAAQGRQPGRPLNLVLALDKSGSMERADRVAITREALWVLASQLQPTDRISVVSFARTARLWADGVPGDRAGELLERVAELVPEGGTDLEDALRLAYETARRHFLSPGINRVILLTDGAANLGEVDPLALQREVEAQRKRGIALDCFGIGWEGYNDDLLEVLSRHGDGRYGFINSPDEAVTGFAAQLTGALQVAAADVKVQVEFNPRRVNVWRQIGYARHQLTKEQFRDNTVDAAELGAAESGTALYVAEVDPRGEGPIGIVRARYRVPATGHYFEHEWTVPYTGTTGPMDSASPALRLATVAAAFSEWLAGSPFAGEVTPDRLLGLLRGVPEAFAPDPRPKTLESMILHAKSIAGK